MEMISGPWDESRVTRWLDEARIPVRLGVDSGHGPRVLSLWYVHLDGALWCATQGDAEVVRWLRDNPACGFEVGPDEPPYRGVRGSAVASIEPDRGEPILRRLIARYLDPDRDAELRDWLLGRAGREVGIRLGELRIASWDYSDRMAA